MGIAGQIVQIPDRKKRSCIYPALPYAGRLSGKFDMPLRLRRVGFNIPTSRGSGSSRFRQARARYSYKYNPPVDNSSKPQFTIQVNLFKDGVLMSEGKPQPAELQDQSDAARILDFGYLRLNPNAKPGDYSLQLVVREPGAGKSDKGSSQWIDFIVE